MMPQHSTKEQVMIVIVVDLPRDYLPRQFAATLHINSHTIAA
jgi:hypothetical protein